MYYIVICFEFIECCSSDRIHKCYVYVLFFILSRSSFTITYTNAELVEEAVDVRLYTTGCAMWLVPFIPQFATLTSFMSPLRPFYVQLNPVFVCTWRTHVPDRSNNSSKTMLLWWRSPFPILRRIRLFVLLGSCSPVKCISGKTLIGKMCRQSVKMYSATRSIWKDVYVRAAQLSCVIHWQVRKWKRKKQIRMLDRGASVRNT